MPQTQTHFFFKAQHPLSQETFLDAILIRRLSCLKNMVTIVEKRLNELPFFSAKAIASSLVLNISVMLDRGSALDWE